MIRSMTGYGKAEAIIEGRQLQVEIKSVNHRYLDISLRMPGAVSSLEGEIRKRIGEEFSRGRVDVNIRMDKDNCLPNGARLELNLPAIRNYYSLLTQMKQELDLDDPVTLSMVAGCKDAFTVTEQMEDAASLWGQLEPVIDAAMKSAVSMREKEGAALGVDFLKRIDLIKANVAAIAQRSPDIVIEYQKRLKERIKELTASIDIDEWRLSQEVAIMAERSDITEEIVRFNSHITQFNELIASDDIIGRKIDFLIQEMNREINTIGSKSSDASISRNVIEIKSELGKLREQVQNIE